MSVKKAIIILLILGVFGVAGVFYFAQNSKQPTYLTETIAVTELIETVSETGSVKAENRLELSFSRTGRVDRITVKVGDMVEKDELIMELDNEALRISREEAQAGVALATQELNKLLAGAEEKDINVARAGVEQAEKSYNSAQNELSKIEASVSESILQAQTEVNDLESDSPENITTYEQAQNTATVKLENTRRTYQKSVDNYKEQAWIAADSAGSIANNALDQIGRILDDDSAENKLSANDLSILSTTISSTNQASRELTEATQYMSDIKGEYTGDGAMALLEIMQLVLDKTYTSLQYSYQALEKSITGSGFTQADLDSFKTKISTQQTNVNAAQSNIQSIKQGLEDAIISYDTNVSAAEQSVAETQAAYSNALKQAKNALAKAEKDGDKTLASARAKVDNAAQSLRVAEAELDRLLAPPSPHDIELARTRVQQAKAGLNSVNNQIEDGQLLAPTNGQITDIMIEEGEQITAGAPAATMLKNDDYEIEVLISEADIAKVETGDPADITLDALGYDRVFKGKVIFIDPAETTVQDVVYYKVTVIFDNNNVIEEAGVKHGMTANVTIVTERKPGVLAAPQRSIVERNGDGSFIRIIDQNGELQEKKVTTGLRGDGGMVEILSGIDAGAKAVTYIEEK
jgi:HlyD family secretion protein